MIDFTIDDVLSFIYLNKEYEVKVENVKNNSLIIRNVTTKTRSMLTYHSYENTYRLQNNLPITNLKVIKEATFPFDQLPIYLKLQILLWTDKQTFIQLGKTEKELYNIVSGKLSREFKQLYGNLDESFYEERCEVCFEKKIIPFRNEENIAICSQNNKLAICSQNNKLSWRSFYHRIRKYMNSITFIQRKLDIYDAASEGDLLKLKYLNSQHSLFTNKYHYNYSEIFRKSIKNGHLHILNWFASECLLPYPNNIRHAIETDNILICFWFEEKNLLPKTWEGYSVKSVSMYEWLIERKYKPHWHDAYVSVQRGNLEILKFLVARNVNVPTTCLDICIQDGYIDILEYFVDNPNLLRYGNNEDQIYTLCEQHLVDAGECQHLHILKFLETRGYFVTKDILTKIVHEWDCENISYDNEILDYYKEKGLVPDIIDDENDDRHDSELFD